MMNDNPINIESDSQDIGSSSLRRRMNIASHSLPYSCMGFKSEIASLIRDFETERPFETPFLIKLCQVSP